MTKKMEEPGADFSFQRMKPWASRISLLKRNLESAVLFEQGIGPDRLARERIERELEQEKKKSEELSAQLGLEKNKVAELSEQLNQFKAKILEDLALLSQQYQDLGKELNDREDSFAALRDMKNSLEAENAFLRKNQSLLNQELRGLQEALSAKDIRIHDVAIQVEDLKSQIERKNLQEPLVVPSARKDASIELAQSLGSSESASGEEVGRGWMERFVDWWIEPVTVLEIPWGSKAEKEEDRHSD